MFQTDPIDSLVNNLPQQNVTTYMLKALDYLAPGEWTNTNNFDALITETTGISDAGRVAVIRTRALERYNAEDSHYQKAMWLYQAVDLSDTALAAAALANKVGEQIQFLSILTKLTPKADVSQSIDLGLKLVAEALAYSQLKGLKADSVGDFVGSLADYGQANLMRMATLVAVDGLIPLGPDFVAKAGEAIGGLNTSGLRNNAIFQRIGNLIPGDDEGAQLGFVQNTFASASSWMQDFRAKRNLTPENIRRSLQSAIAFTDDKLDYLSAFLDATTNYYTHTGVQTVARQVIGDSA
ncbi:MAG: hypothetical protein DWQ07_08320 [Chloroflexi bacterium]|nr:MAG: hypothetical protein DWQ07_08320 [Chloroflexota bacterium]MBL1193284.1 hypothetical protein [Chloroflexota bacterium]NOH10576.1 hypothetical protein [Chloroflexota bacterium]